MSESSTKNGLIIDVWEKLDCESVGSDEIIAIENAVRERFGKSAVDSPMVIARLLADEGAELRHSEIMTLFVERYADCPYAPSLRNIINVSSFESTLATIRNVENLRRKFVQDGDAEGLRLLRERVIRAKTEVIGQVDKPGLEDSAKAIKLEIAEWLRLWLQSPELFENWIVIRKNSLDFKTHFEETT
ncbi:MAG: hypothetical protein ACT4O9_01750 [Blastocatellia bacterium]